MSAGLPQLPLLPGLKNLVRIDLMGFLEEVCIDLALQVEPRVAAPPGLHAYPDARLVPQQRGPKRDQVFHRDRAKRFHVALRQLPVR